MASGEGTWAVTRWAFSERASCQVFYNSTTAPYTSRSDPKNHTYPQRPGIPRLQILQKTAIQNWALADPKTFSFCYKKSDRNHGSRKKVSKSQIHARGEVTVHLLDDKNFYFMRGILYHVDMEDRCVAIGGHQLIDLFAHKGIDTNTPTNYPNAANPKMTEEIKRCQS